MIRATHLGDTSPWRVLVPYSHSRQFLFRTRAGFTLPESLLAHVRMPIKPYRAWQAPSGRLSPPQYVFSSRSSWPMTSRCEVVRPFRRSRLLPEVPLEFATPHDFA